MLKTLYIYDFESWRNQARMAINANLKPDFVTWKTKCDDQTELFDVSYDNEKLENLMHFKVSKAFIKLAKIVSCHSDKEKWSLLYQALWQLTVEKQKNLLELKHSPLVKKLFLMQHAVLRDSHKMKAFVRFKRFENETMQESLYIAYYKPLHDTLALTSGFFKKRFAFMCWCIITPYVTISWNKHKLQFYSGMNEMPKILKTADLTEELWLTFYSAIFNPARIKTKAMLNEMPKAYWSTMPETQLIQKLILDAPKRVQKMLELKVGL